MRFTVVMGILMLCLNRIGYSQEPDTIRQLSIQEIVVTENYKLARNRYSTVQMEVVRKDFLEKNFSGSLMQTLERLPGVHSMDIGSGFSKPMIRGMGFNRVSVTEYGIKQEGQQWGADHGLEIDAFNVEQVNIRKGPASLLYGSDAMGGVVEITNAPPPLGNQVFGEATFIAKSVSDLFGGSVMVGLKKNGFYTKLRYSEQHFGDYRVPTDSIVYLTLRIPIRNKRLKNTAGLERNVNWFGEYRKGNYKGNYSVSNIYQKVGFFPGAHGIPDASRVEDDGDSRNIDLPFSKVNHLKATSHQQYTWESWQLQWNAGYQNNHREEWSLFHTHYGNQNPPLKDPDKELLFNLNTFSSAIKLRLFESAGWEHTAGWDFQYQHNTVGGYSFLLPEYKRWTTGFFWLTNYHLNDKFTLSGGLRYDHGNINSEPYEDPYLATYLEQQGYSEEEIAANRIRSHKVNRSLGDWSGSIGIIWQPAGGHLIKANIGHSFRLPGPNELASNGVHHGTFRHEQGNASLKSEKGWQMDLAYSWFGKYLTVNISPFLSWFSNYIYLRPTGKWSILPHAGQIYRYTEAEALFAGAELSAELTLPFNLQYNLTGEYVYTYNCDDHIPLSFSPPGSLRNHLNWTWKTLEVFAEHHFIASQNRVDRNEDRTPGAHLMNAGVNLSFPMAGNTIELTLSGRNLLNKRYYNHLSFYRKIEIPEPGRSFQLMLKVPFKINLK